MKRKLRKFIKEAIDKIMTKPRSVSFIAAIVEDDADINMLSNNAYQYGIPDGWIRPKRNGQLDYHMTISLGDLQFSSKQNIVNTKVDLKIVAIGKSDDAIAFKEEGDMYSKNDLKHITIAYNSNGGSPKMAKKITEWVEIDPFIVKSIVRQIDHDNNVIIGIDLNEIGSEVKAGVFPNHAVAAGASSIFPQVQDSLDNDHQ